MDWTSEMRGGLAIETLAEGGDGLLARKRVRLMAGGCGLAGRGLKPAGRLRWTTPPPPLEASPLRLALCFSSRPHHPRARAQQPAPCGLPASWRPGLREPSLAEASADLRRPAGGPARSTQQGLYYKHGRKKRGYRTRRGRETMSGEQQRSSRWIGVSDWKIVYDAKRVVPGGRGPRKRGGTPIASRARRRRASGAACRPSP
jgi:hypothetical protein